MATVDYNSGLQLVIELELILRGRGGWSPFSPHPPVVDPPPLGLLEATAAGAIRPLATYSDLTPAVV